MAEELDEEDEAMVRLVALHAAATFWSGASQVKDSTDQKVINTAKRFEKYVKEGE